MVLPDAPEHAGTIRRHEVTPKLAPLAASISTEEPEWVADRVRARLASPPHEPGARRRPLPHRQFPASLTRKVGS